MDDEAPLTNQQDDDQQRVTNPAQASSGQAGTATGASGSNLAADYAAAQEIHENEQVNIQTPEEGLDIDETETSIVSEDDDAGEQVLNSEDDDILAAEDDEIELPEDEEAQTTGEQELAQEDQDDEDEDAADDEVGRAAPDDEDAEDQTRNDSEPEASPGQPAETPQPTVVSAEPQVVTPGSVVSPTMAPETAQAQTATDAPAEGGGIITGQFDPAAAQTVDSLNNEAPLDEGGDDPDTSDETGDTTADPADEVLTPATDTTNVENIINDAFGEEFTGGQGDVGGFIGEGGDEA